MTDNEKLIERRRFLRHAATVAWAAPVILTVAAPAANAQTAVSCVRPGSACGSGSPTPGNPCCDDTGDHCCCQETKSNGTIIRTCEPVAKCASSGQGVVKICVPGL